MGVIETLQVILYGGWIQHQLAHNCSVYAFEVYYLTYRFCKTEFCSSSSLLVNYRTLKFIEIQPPYITYSHNLMPPSGTPPLLPPEPAKFGGTPLWSIWLSRAPSSSSSKEKRLLNIASSSSVGNLPNLYRSRRQLPQLGTSGPWLLRAIQLTRKSFKEYNPCSEKVGNCSRPRRPRTTRL